MAGGSANIKLWVGLTDLPQNMSVSPQRRADDASASPEAGALGLRERQQTLGFTCL